MALAALKTTLLLPIADTCRGIKVLSYAAMERLLHDPPGIRRELDNGLLLLVHGVNRLLQAVAVCCLGAFLAYGAWFHLYAPNERAMLLKVEGAKDGGDVLRFVETVEASQEHVRYLSAVLGDLGARMVRSVSLLEVQESNSERARKLFPTGKDGADGDEWERDLLERAKADAKRALKAISVGRTGENGTAEGAVGVTKDWASGNIGAAVVPEWSGDADRDRLEGVIASKPPVPGVCWKVPLDRAVLALKLYQPLKLIEGITLVSPLPEVTSSDMRGMSPKTVDVEALYPRTDTSDPFTIPLGKVRFEEPKELRQTVGIEASVKLVVASRKEPVEYVRLTFLENYGDEKYVCVYGVQIHGTPA